MVSELNGDPTRAGPSVPFFRQGNRDQADQHPCCRNIGKGQDRSHHAEPRNGIRCRRQAAAATGPTTKLASDSAHKIENGVPNDNGPVIAAVAVSSKTRAKAAMRFECLQPNAMLVLLPR